MKHPLATVLAEKELAFKMQYKNTRAQVEAAPETDLFFGDNTASFVAAVNVARVAQLAVEVIALRKAMV